MMRYGNLRIFYACTELSRIEWSVDCGNVSKVVSFQFHLSHGGVKISGAQLWLISFLWIFPKSHGYVRQTLLRQSASTHPSLKFDGESICRLWATVVICHMTMKESLHWHSLHALSICLMTFRVFCPMRNPLPPSPQICWKYQKFWLICIFWRKLQSLVSKDNDPQAKIKVLLKYYLFQMHKLLVFAISVNTGWGSFTSPWPAT